MPTVDDVIGSLVKCQKQPNSSKSILLQLLFAYSLKPSVDTVNFIKLLDRINGQMLGQLITNAKQHRNELKQLEPLLRSALNERNRLGHAFYRRHAVHKFSDAGRAMMMEDLEQVHKTLVEALTAFSCATGIDVGEVWQIFPQAMMGKAGKNNNRDADDDDPPFDLPL